MKIEDKKLLYRDLCARLPYGVKIEVTYSKESGSSLRAKLCHEGINILDTNILWLFQQSEIYIKPYLFSLSSMTEEEIKEYKHLVAFSGSHSGAANFIDWLNTHHFDYNGLIPTGLANNAVELNIY